MTTYIIIIAIILTMLNIIITLAKSKNSELHEDTLKSYGHRRFKKRKKKIIKKSSNDEIIQLIKNYENNKNTQ